MDDSQTGLLVLALSLKYVNKVFLGLRFTGISAHADVAELVDAHVSGTCGLVLWEFKSPHPH